MKNLKDKITNVAGVVVAICTVLLTAGQNGLVLPSWANSTLGGLIAVSVALIGYFTGKNPNGTTPTISAAK